MGSKVTSLQDIIFCVPQKKEYHTALEQHEGERITSHANLPLNLTADLSIPTRTTGQTLSLSCLYARSSRYKPLR